MTNERANSDREQFKKVYTEAIERSGIPSLSEVRLLIADLMLEEDSGELPTLSAFVKPFVSSSAVPISWLNGSVLEEIYLVLNERKFREWQTRFIEDVVKSDRAVFNISMPVTDENRKYIHRHAVEFSIRAFDLGMDIAAKDVEHFELNVEELTEDASTCAMICEMRITTKDGTKTYGPQPVGGMVGKKRSEND